jgi:hypothetical protein
MSCDRVTGCDALTAFGIFGEFIKLLFPVKVLLPFVDALPARLVSTYPFETICFESLKVGSESYLIGFDESRVSSPFRISTMIFKFTKSVR